jgi:hypothetical protein
MKSRKQKGGSKVESPTGNERGRQKMVGSILTGYLSSTPGTEWFDVLSAYQEVADPPISETVCYSRHRAREGNGVSSV